MENQDPESNGEVLKRLVNEEKVENAGETENQVSKWKWDREFAVQMFLIVLLIFAAATSGMAMGYSAILLPQLKSVNGTLYTDEEMGSWIASIFPAFTPVGSLLSGLMIHYFGRLVTLKIQTFIAASSWIFVIFCKDHAVLLIGRLVAGAASGLGVVAGQVYIAEVANPRMRGVIGSIPFLSYALGILIVYALGSILHWRVVAGICMVPPFISIFMYLKFHESPVWLVLQGRVEEAKEASLFFRGNDPIKAKQEVQQLIARAEQEKLQQQQNRQSTWETFCRPEVLKPLIITNLFNFLQTLTGIYLIIFYAVDIISETAGANVNQMFAAVLSAGVRLLFTIVGCFLLAFIGRRTLGLYSSLGTAVSSLILGTFLYLNSDNNNTNGYFAATVLLIYVAFNTVGLLLLPAIMMGELFPTKARSLAGSVTYTIFSLFTFAVAKMFPFLKNHLKMHGLFWLFGIASILLSTLIYLVLPETKNKTLHEIEDYFLQDNMLWVTRNRKKRNVNEVSDKKNGNSAI